MKRVTFKRGRYTLFIWPPVVWNFDRAEEWPLMLAWAWRSPRRWKFPHDGQGATTRPVLCQGICCGPIDIRRVHRRDA